MRIFFNALAREHSHIEILYSDAEKGVGEEARAEKEAAIRRILQAYDEYEDEAVLYIDLIRQVYRPNPSYREPEPVIMQDQELTEEELSSDTDTNE